MRPSPTASPLRDALDFSDRLDRLAAISKMISAAVYGEASMTDHLSEFEPVLWGVDDLTKRLETLAQEVAAKGREASNAAERVRDRDLADGASASTGSGALSYKIDIAALHKLPLSELRALSGALGTLNDILCGFAGQPRFCSGADGNPNQAGALVEELIELVGGYQQEVVNIAKAAKPSNPDETWDRGWALLHYEAWSAEDLAGFAVMAAEAARDFAGSRPPEQQDAA